MLLPQSNISSRICRSSRSAWRRAGVPRPTPRLPPARLNPWNRESSSSSNSSGEGNESVQEALSELMMIQVRKQEVKQQILDDVEVRKGRLREIGNEITDEFEQGINLDKMRMDIATNRSLAETNERFQELEDEVQAVRDRLKADGEELKIWEQASAVAKSKGLFFRSLYTTAKKEASSPGEEDLNKEVTKQWSNRVKEPARDEVHSPMRLYIFTYLATVVLFIPVLDIADGSPNVMLDMLYAVAGVAMAINAWSERQALTSSIDGEK